jgi:hypothetical protein
MLRSKEPSGSFSAHVSAASDSDGHPNGHILGDDDLLPLEGDLALPALKLPCRGATGSLLSPQVSAGAKKLSSPAQQSLSFMNPASGSLSEISPEAGAEGASKPPGLEHSCGIQAGHGPAHEGLSPSRSQQSLLDAEDVLSPLLPPSGSQSRSEDGVRPSHAAAACMLAPGAAAGGGALHVCSCVEHRVS